MTTLEIETWISVLVALSAATERLVEIIKSYFASLSNDPLPGSPAARTKNRRIHMLAIGCGILTAFLAKEWLGMGFTHMQVIALGVLSGGGSSFWNSILDYVLAVKKTKTGEVERRIEAAFKAGARDASGETKLSKLVEMPV